MRTRGAIGRSAFVAAFLVAICAPASLAGDGGHRDEGRDDHSGGRFTYAIIGDTPYGTPQLTNFPNDVSEINADPQVRLVVHLGDIKNGSSACDTTYFQTILDDFNGFQDPLIYTPGDNEWTDCHRASNGGYLPTERLDTLRSMFFAHPADTLGGHFRDLEAQRAPYVENVRWSQSGVQFGTLNVPGSNNDQLLWFDPTPTSDPTDDPARTQAQIDEVNNRTAADIVWLHRIFSEARGSRANAVVLGIQADMWDPVFSGVNDQPLSYDHFTSFVQALARESRAWRKPVLLLNGDSHIFVDDHPLASDAPAYQLSMYGVDQPVPNLERITINGSTTPCHEWLKLTIDLRSNGIFSYDRVRFHNQPGFDPNLCSTT